MDEGQLAAWAQSDSREIHHEVCQLCAGPIQRQFNVETDAGRFEIVRCRNCRFAFVEPTPSEAYIIDFYEHVGSGEGGAYPSAAAALAAEAKAPNSTLDAERVARTIAGLTSGRRALDVGCGHGFFSRAMKLAGFSCEAIELSAERAGVAAELNDYEPVASTFEQYEGGPFDAIVMSQVLEHAREPMFWLGKAYDLLSPGGVLAIALPNFGSVFTDVLGPRDPYVTPPEHLNYFAPANLRMGAERAGFRTAKVETVTRFPRAAFKRRFGPLGAPAHGVFSLSMRAADAWGKGVMLNAYFVKPG